VQRRPQQRPGAARHDRHVTHADEIPHAQRVGRRDVQADVACHRGDPADFQAGIAVREDEREGVVDPRVAVNDDLLGHAACSSRRLSPSSQCAAA